MRQRRRPGDFISIPLGDALHSYARVLPRASYCFYAYQGDEALEVAAISELSILFYAAVMDSAVKTGRWSVVGHIALDGSLLMPAQFIQDALNPNRFEIYEHDGSIRRATKEECLGLERASAWYPEHIEDRLRDCFAGRENKWVELEKLS